MDKTKQVKTITKPTTLNVSLLEYATLHSESGFSVRDNRSSCSNLRHYAIHGDHEQRCHNSMVTIEPGLNPVFVEYEGILL